jgi:uncharacterized protein YbjT (DUF2867 family)
VRTSSAPEKVAELRTLADDLAVGDLKSRQSLDDACRGVKVVFSTATALLSPQPDDSLDRVDREGQTALIDAAAAAGVERFVYVSVLKIEPRFTFGSAKHAVEARLKASGMDYTILQPSCFMDTWLTPHTGFDYDKGQVTIYGDGTRPLAFVLSSEVARVAVDAAASPDARNVVLAVVGPERVTPLDAVRVFEEVSGRQFQVQMVPQEALEAQLAAASNPVEQAFAGLMLRVAAGDPTDVVPLPATVPAPSFSIRDFARRVLGA